MQSDEYQKWQIMNVHNVMVYTLFNKIVICIYVIIINILFQKIRKKFAVLITKHYTYDDGLYLQRQKYCILD